MTEQDYAARVRTLRAVAEDALDCMTDAWPDRPVTRALRDALLAAPAPNEPGLASDHPDCGGYCDCYFRGRLRG